MVSSWTNHLAIEVISPTVWRIGTYRYSWLGSIYELIPEEDLYDESGELIIPEEWNGHKIQGLADGEYLETDELRTIDYVDITSDKFNKVLEFCKESGWDKESNYERVLVHIAVSLNPLTALSEIPVFNGKPLISTISETNPSGPTFSELGINCGDFYTDIWVWNSDFGSECVSANDISLELTSLIREIANNEDISCVVNFNNISIKGLDSAQGRLIALAWDEDDGSKVIAKLLTRWTLDIIRKILATENNQLNEIVGLGYSIIELSNNLDIDPEEITKLEIPEEFDHKTILNTISKVIKQKAVYKRRKQREYQKLIEPFESDIESIVKEFMKDKRRSYYPGAGYVVPHPAGANLRKYLQDHVRKYKSLPKGEIDIPTYQGDSGRLRGAMRINFDLIKANIRLENE